MAANKRSPPAGAKAEEQTLKKARPSAGHGEPVLFYATKGEYGFLSNFSRHPLKVDGLDYKTSEHLYQCQKSSNTIFRERIRLARTPAAAAKLGRSTACPLIADWDTRKVGIMERVLREKLRCNPGLKEALLKSGDRPLIEASPRDAFWGWGKNRDGENHLGKLWMKLREELGSQQ